MAGARTENEQNLANQLSRSNGAGKNARSPPPILKGPTQLLSRNSCAQFPFQTLRLGQAVLLQVDQHRFPIRILGQFPITLLRLQITAWHTWYGPSFSPPKASQRMPIDFPSLILVKPLETQHHKVTKYIKIKINQYNSSLETCHQPRMV